MDEITRLLSGIVKSTDERWLLQCRDFNRRKRPEVVDAVNKRLSELELLASLKLKPGAGATLEDRVAEGLRVYEALLKAKHGKGQPAGYLRRSIKNNGPREALVRTLRTHPHGDSMGFELLARHDRLDCSSEQIALDFASELPADVVEIARRTLADLGKGRGPS